MKPILTTLLIFFSIGVMAQKKDSIGKNGKFTNERIEKNNYSQTGSAVPDVKVTNPDSLETISIQDLNTLLLGLDNAPTFTKHDYDKVKQSLEFLIQISQQRRTKPKK